MMNPGNENEVVFSSESPAGEPNRDFSSYWGKSPTSADSMSTAATANMSTTSYPGHSDFYATQPAMASESDYLQKKKDEDANKGNGGGVGGAAAVAGIAGLVLMGPITAVAAAGGAAYVAGTNKGVVGSAFRASGRGAQAVGGAASRFNQKHQVVQKTARGIGTGVGWVSKKWNQKSRRSSNAQAAEANLTS